MAKVQPFDPSMLPDLQRSLLGTHDRRLSRDDWEKVFCHDRNDELGPCGYVLLDGRRIVGVLGTIFSSRVIDGEPARFCNLHTWVVDEHHRGQSLLLMRPVLKLTDHTLTDLSPSTAVYEIERRLGFEELDCHMRVLLPVRSSTAAEGANRRILTDETVIEQRLDDRQLQLFRDHRGHPCGHLLVSDEGRSCHVIYTRVSRGPFSYCFVHHLSDRQLFERMDRQARGLLLEASRTRFAVVDSRLVEGLALANSFVAPVKARRLYRSPDLKPHQVDGLYSELIRLNLSGFGNVSLGLRHALRRIKRRA